MSILVSIIIFILLAIIILMSISVGIGIGYEKGFKSCDKLDKEIINILTKINELQGQSINDYQTKISKLSKRS